MHLPFMMHTYIHIWTEHIFLEGSLWFKNSFLTLTVVPQKTQALRVPLILK